MNKCLKCKKETRNPKFCSRSCSVSFMNKACPKRKRIHNPACDRCGVMHTAKRKYCQNCWNIIRSEQALWKTTVTMGEIRAEGNVNQKRNSYVRSLARKNYLSSGLPMECAVCGYDLFVDIAHIYAVASFPNDAFVFEVNDISNMIALCKNHHWEYDNGHLSLTTILDSKAVIGVRIASEIPSRCDRPDKVPIF